MLVLSRRVGEDICLPDLGVTIKVMRTAAGRVSIGVDAPREAKILRGELKPKRRPAKPRCHAAAPPAGSVKPSLCG